MAAQGAQEPAAYDDQNAYAYDDQGYGQGYDQQGYADPNAYDQSYQMETGQQQPQQQLKDLQRVERAASISEVAQKMRDDSAYYRCGDLITL